MKKILELGIYLILAFAIILFGYIIFSLFFPFNVVDIKNNPVPTDKEFYYPGDRLIYNLDSCVYIPGPVIITKSFVDDIVYILPEKHVNQYKGCRNEQISSTIIPENLPPGKYYLLFRAEHEINPFRQITVEWKTEEFTILPKVS